MEKIIAFESAPEHYVAQACVVWCFDDRFYKLLKAFGKQEGWQHIDLVKAAGGAGADRDFLLGQIKASIRLHGAKRVVLMTHRDCGAYGGSKNFASVEAEVAAHEAALAAMRSFLASELGADIAIETYFADFDGLYRTGV